MPRPLFPRWVVRSVQALAGVLGLLLLVLIFLAAMPVGIDGLNARPAPMPDYATSRARVARLEREEARLQVKPECRTQLLGPGRPTPQVYVLFHGLTNCPQQMSDVARQLAARGNNVLLVRIPGHGLPAGGVGNLGDLDAERLRAVTDESVDVAQGLGRSTTVIGLSLGGVMAAWALQQRAEVQRAVVIAPVLRLGNVPSWTSDAMRNTFSRLPALVLPGTGVQREHHTYPDATPLRPTAEALRFASRVRADAPARDLAGKELALVLNDADVTIANSDVRAFADQSRQHHARVTGVILPAALGLPHDIMDHTQRHVRPALTDPLVVALAQGKPIALPAGARRP